MLLFVILMASTEVIVVCSVNICPSHICVMIYDWLWYGQDSAANLPDSQASTALKLANDKYREALRLLPGHAEAAYNLATCLSEQADLLSTYEDQVGFDISFIRQCNGF